MCGIVGYITDEVQTGVNRRDKFMRQALIMDTLRGKDSTGVFGALSDNKGYSPGWLRQLGDGFSFVESNDYAAFERYIYKYCVGHNRAATIGNVTLDNAHPFQEGPITLVHNGSLWSTSLLPKTQEELGVEVDSHAICHNLAISEPEEVISNLDGAFALVWQDDRDDSLNIVRNSERPIHLAQVRNEKTIVFMSEAEMLNAVASRIHMPLEAIVYPKPGQWLKFTPGRIHEPEIKQIPLHTTKYRTYYQGAIWRGGAMKDDDKKWYERNPPNNVTPLHPYTRGKRSPQPEAPDDNRIRVGGRRRPVPIRAQEMLLELDLLVEQRLAFTPVSQSDQGGKVNGPVSGHIGTRGLTGIVYGVSPEMFNRCKRRVWQVRPVAVKYLDVSEPAVICKVVSTVGPPQEDKTEDDEKGSLPVCAYPGKNGIYVSAGVLAEQISGGCIQCGAVLTRYDANEISWVNDGCDPMCGPCVTYYKEKFDETEIATIPAG